MITTEQIDWLDDHAAASGSPVFVMGHHQQWIGGAGGSRSDDYFGLHPDGSDALDDAVRAPHERPGLRRRAHPSSSGATDDPVGRSVDRGRVHQGFPGTWAEYRVYEGGVMQVVHRMSSPEALAWSEACRYLYSDFGVDYASYALGTLADRCFVIPVQTEPDRPTAP